jgi:Cu/Ag efflux pump CusA
LATVIIGGLITATALTLIVLPAVYFVVERWLLAKIHVFPAQGR